MRLPRDIARCLGRRSLTPDSEICPRRDTCLRHLDTPQRAPGEVCMTPVDLWVCSDDRFAAWRPMPPENEYTARRGLQHVLKAEGDGPDATDRSAPAISSPGGGLMGVWQSPAGDPPGVTPDAARHLHADGTHRLPGPTAWPPLESTER